MELVLNLPKETDFSMHPERGVITTGADNLFAFPWAHQKQSIMVVTKASECGKTSYQHRQEVRWRHTKIILEFGVPFSSSTVDLPSVCYKSFGSGDGHYIYIYIHFQEGIFSVLSEEL